MAYVEAEGKSADDIIAEKGLKQETDTGTRLKRIIDRRVAANEKWLKSTSLVRKAFNGLVGQVVKAAKGKANPAK